MPFTPPATSVHPGVLGSHIAMWLTGTPPARENIPPAYTFPFRAARAMTTPSVPLPRSDQDEPFHFAACGEATVSAMMNEPPTYRPVSLAARAKTVLSVPPRNGNQFSPSHLAICCA